MPAPGVGPAPRILNPDYAPPRNDPHDLDEMVTEPIWLEPYPDLPAGQDTDPAARLVEREGIELAFVAALQHLPGRPRAVLILREVLNALGDQGQRELVTAFVAAWERADITALVSLLAEDARFSMPPLPAWFDGRADIGRFMIQRMWETPWRLVPVRANGQLAVACYQGSAPGAPEAPFRLSAINVITLRGGRIAELAGFLDPAVCRRFGLAAEFPRLR